MSPEIPLGRWILALISIVVILCAATWLLAVEAIQPHAGSRALSIALASLVVQGGGLFLVVSASVIAKSRRSAYAARLRTTAPPLRSALAAHLGGQDQAELLRIERAKHGRLFDEIFLEFLAPLAGVQRMRLGALAERLGVMDAYLAASDARNPVRRRAAVAALRLISGPSAWTRLEQCLADPDAGVRMEAARALIESDPDRGAERVFEHCLDAPPIARALLVMDLKKHSLLLAEGPLRRVLRDGRQQQLLAALDLVRGWQAVLSLPEIALCLPHHSPEVRVAACRALPYCLPAGFPENWWEHLLNDDSPCVRSAAASAIGALRPQTSRHAVEKMLLAEAAKPAASRDVLLAASAALACFGAPGLAALDRASLSDQRAAASVALETIERFRMRGTSHAGAV